MSARDSVHGPEAKERLAALLDELAARKPPVRIVRKLDAWHQRVADVFLRIVTLGGQRTYLSHYVTTLGHSIYVPEDWDEWPPGRAWETLRHELVHVRQFERWTWPGMVLVYGFFPLPLGLAWGRARLEWEAYAETLRATADLEGLDAAKSPDLEEHIVRRFTGPDYGWMWPFPETVRGWIREELRRIERWEPRRPR